MGETELAKALAALAPQPPAEYCLLWVQHWAMCMQKAEWASWAQGVGTFLAIVGALLIAGTETRSRKLEELALAEVHAAGILHMLNPLLGRLSLVQMELEGAATRCDVLEMRRIHDDLKHVGRPSLEQASKIVSLRNGIYARALAQCAGVLDQLEELLRVSITPARSLDQAIDFTNAAKWGTELATAAAQQLELVRKGLNEALDFREVTS